MLGRPSSSFGFSKLPRTEAVLGIFLLHHEGKTLKDSAVSVTKELKDVWQHHFGPLLIMGNSYDGENIVKSEQMIKDDQKIQEKIIKH